MNDAMEASGRASGRPESCPATLTRPSDDRFAPVPGTPEGASSAAAQSRSAAAPALARTKVDPHPGPALAAFAIGALAVGPEAEGVLAVRGDLHDVLVVVDHLLEVFAIEILGIALLPLLRMWIFGGQGNSAGGSKTGEVFNGALMVFDHHLREPANFRT